MDKPIVFFPPSAPPACRPPVKGYGDPGRLLGGDVVGAGPTLLLENMKCSSSSEGIVDAISSRSWAPIVICFARPPEESGFPVPEFWRRGRI